jgi:cytochrome P450
MTTAEIHLAAPQPPGPHTKPRDILFRARENWISSFGEDAFREKVLERRVLWRRNLVLNDPAGIRHVLLDNAQNYSKTLVARRLLEPGLGKGLITLEGEQWRRHRRIMAPAFDFQSITAAVPVMAASAERVLARWDRLADAGTIEMVEEMRRATLRIIAETMFAADASGIEDLVADTVARYQRRLRPSLLDLIGMPEWVPQLRQRYFGRVVFAELTRAIDRIIEDRKAKPDVARPDLLSRLVAAHDGGPLTPKEIRSEVVTIFMAGHETTALALTWTWYLLSLHPESRGKLEAELDRVLQGRTPSAADVPQLVYTRMVIDETLRLYPPAHTISRQALGPDEICGVKVKKGAIVFMMPWLLHRHRTLWDEPLRFMPERFAPERADARPRFGYIPFGAGPRICIGAAFALTEAVVLLAALAQRYRPQLVRGEEVEPAGLITLRPKGGLHMTLERR